MLAPRRGPLLSFFWSLHRMLSRLSRGWLGSRLGPFRTLTTTGRRSGRAVHVVLSHVDHGGHPRRRRLKRRRRSPSGLVHQPIGAAIAEALIDDERRRVRARTPIGDERERLWREFVSRDSSYAEYQRRTSGQIPVVALERADSAA